MRKLFTFLLLAIFVSLGNYGLIKGQNSYKKYLINENFDGLNAFPDGWSGIVNSESQSVMSAASGSDIVVGNGVVNITGTGNGTRGGELVFPGTLSNTEMAASGNTWFVELDWVVTNGVVRFNNAMGIIFLGPNSDKLDATSGLETYMDAIFSLYVAGDSKVLHLWNKDLTFAVPGSSYETAGISSPVFVTGKWPEFSRAGSTNAICDDYNSTTKTSITYNAGKTYHIAAELNFETKRVVSLTVTDKSDPDNAETFTDLPFISDQVTELDRISVTNTRSSNAGNGAAVNLDNSIDNLEIYQLEEVAGEIITVYDINEDFDSNDLGTWGFVSSGGGLVFTNTNGYLDLLIQNPSGTATKTFETAIEKGEDGKVYFDFDWYLGAAPRLSNLCTFYIRDIEGNKIFGAGAMFATNKGFRVINYGLATGETDIDITDESTIVGTFNFNTTLNIKLAIDLNTKTLSLTATNTADDVTVTLDDLPFIDDAAAGVADLYFDWVRGGSGNGNYRFDNFKIYHYEEVSGLANVTVNYIDADGNSIKTSRIEEDLPLGTTYALLASDKESFIDNDIFYVYDAEATGSGEVEVEAGAEINVIFKATPVTEGLYVWTGEANGNWSEFDDNFSVEGASSIGYQAGNAVRFDGTVEDQEVTVVGTIDLGDKDVTVTGGEYTFLTGANGKLTGSGKFILNTSAVLDITNELEGGVELKSGTLEVKKDAAGNSYSVAANTTLNVNTGAAFGKAIEGDGAFTIIPTSNAIYTSAITGVDQLNYQLVSRGSVASTGGDFTGMPRLNNVYSGAIKVSTDLEELAMFGTTLDLADNSLYLDDNVALVYPANIGSSASPTGTIKIGELSGTADSKFMGPRIRNVDYHIGGLNTSSVFAGTIENFEADLWNNIPTITLYKVGEGALTLTGESTGYIAGAVNVNEGTLVVDGILAGLTEGIVNADSTTVTVTVAEGAVLHGSGLINAATTINGTLSGSLSFADSLTVQNTANVSVSISELTSELKVFTVNGDLIIEGGTLAISVDENPTSTVTVAIFDVAGEIRGEGFTDINLPEGEEYSYDAETGILTFTVQDPGELTAGNVTIANITHESAMVASSAGNTTKFQTVEFGFCYSKTEELPTTADEKVVGTGSINAFGYKLTGLEDETVYYVRSYITTDDETVYGEVKSFTTLKDPGLGIDGAVNSKTIESVEYFDLTGKKVSENEKGFVIARIVYTDGSVESKKNFNK